MTLTETAYLEIEGDSSTATFEISIGLQYQSSLSKSYLMGEQGQYLREIVVEVAVDTIELPLELVAEPREVFEVTHGTQQESGHYETGPWKNPCFPLRGRAVDD